MSRASLRRAAQVLRLSYSQILRLRRCPWAWHARHVRGLVPLRRRRPPPAWGDAYHAAAALVWQVRAWLERDGDVGLLWQHEDALHAHAHEAATARLRELDVPGLDAEALAAEVAQAAVEACRFVGREWRVLWLGGDPVVERRLVLPLGPLTSWSDHKNSKVVVADVELLAVLDLALVRDDGVVRVVDHKTTTSWPEEVGDALHPDEPLDLDLRDDFQVRLYVLALRHALILAAGRCEDLGPIRWRNVVDAVDIEGAHLVRRASVGAEPPQTGRGNLSRDKRHEYTEEQLLRAIRRHHLRVEDYEEQLARARRTRWQAWAPVEFTQRSLERARREVLRAAEDAARYGDLDADDVPRFHLPGRWQPHRPQRWSGLAPRDQAECFAWSACAACDHRELCVAELDGDEERAHLLRLADFAHASEEREARAEGADPSCELDADEV